MSEASYQGHDADRALAAARQVDDLTRRLGEPPQLAALTQIAFAYAHLAAGRAADAIEPAHVSLDLHRRVNQAHAGWSAMLLAEALLADVKGSMELAEQFDPQSGAVRNDPDCSAIALSSCTLLSCDAHLTWGTA